MTMRISGVNVDPFTHGESVASASDELLTTCRVMVVKPFNECKCIAERCLEAERITCEVHSVEPTRSYVGNPEAYAGHFVHAWQQLETFINVEHDIAPWPGALIDLWHCPNQWCYYRYPKQNSRPSAPGIGCMKFGEHLLKAMPQSWENWGNLPWWDLDAGILDDIKSFGVLGHEHHPSVAHARRSPGVAL